MFNPAQFYEAGRLKLRPTVIEIDTRKVLSGSDKEITIAYTTNFFGSIDWDDGVVEYYNNSSPVLINHIYAIAGKYDIKVKISQGYFFNLQINNFSHRNKFLKIKDFGSSFKIVDYAFYGATNLDLSSSLGVPKIESGILAFQNCTSLTTINNFEKWDFSNITSANFMFAGCINFNPPNFNLNLTNALSIQTMLDGCTKFNPVEFSLNIPNVTGAIALLRNCKAFKPSVFNLILPKATQIGQLLSGCTAFNPTSFYLDSPLSTDGAGALGGCTSFSPTTSFTLKLDSSVDMNGFLGSVPASFSPENFYVSAINATSINGFNYKPLFNPLSFFLNIPKVTSFQIMFDASTAFNPTTFFYINTAGATTMLAMLRGCTAFNQNAGIFNISNVTNMGQFMSGKTPSTLSPSTLDAILIGWAGQSVKPNQAPNFGTAKRTSASNAAYAILTSSPNNWTITHGGLI